MDVPTDDYDIKVMIQAVKEVMEVLESPKISSFMELDAEISKTLKRYNRFGDGFERFRSYIVDVKGAAEKKDVGRSVMLQRCEEQLRECECSQKDIINLILPFIRNTSRILVHGSGMLLASTVALAIEEREGAHFFICEGCPSRQGCDGGSGAQLLARMAQTAEGMRLPKEKLESSCTIIPDSSVGSIMNSVDFVITGAYCVTEHGGLVHAIGSSQIGMVAMCRNVPIYVLCESFKFAHVFPLTTEDLKQPDEGAVIPLIEFVPPPFITLIFSEQGIMPPSAVADEMFQRLLERK